MKIQSKLNHFESENEIKSNFDFMLDFNWCMLSRIVMMKLSVTLTALKVNLSTLKNVEKTEQIFCKMWFEMKVFYYFYTQNQHFSNQENHWHVSWSLTIMSKVLQLLYIHQTWLLFNDWSNFNFLCQILWFDLLH